MAAKKKRSTKKSSGGGKVEKVMHEYKHGQLRSSTGAKVKSRKQAIAIGLSEAREAGENVGPKKKASRKKTAKKANEKKTAKRATKKTTRRSTRRTKKPASR